MRWGRWWRLVWERWFEVESQDALGLTELMGVLCEMPSGWPKVRLLEEAVRNADEAGILEARVSLRRMLFNEVIVLDYPRVIPVVSELNQVFEENPNAFSDACIRSVLFDVAAAIEAVMEVPEVPLAQWLSMTDAYRDQLKRFGKGERSYFYMMARLYHQVDLDAAMDWLEKVWEAPESGTDECVPCLHATSIKIYIQANEAERAQEHIDLIDSGRVGQCPESRQWRYQAVIEHLLDQGRPDEAQPLAEKLLRIGNRYPNDKDYIGLVMRTRAHLEPEKALSLFQKRLVWTIGATDLLGLFDFYQGSWAVMHALGRQRDLLELRLPREFACFRGGGAYDPADLEAWFADQLDGIAQRFDARNGNGFMRSKLDALFSSMDA